MPLPKTLQRLALDPKVDEILDERGDENGYWIYLKPGWINEATETHCIHEMTVKECMDYWRNYVRPCSCEDCKKARGSKAEPALPSF